MKEILLTSSILILVLGLLRYLLRGRINLHLQYALWLLVAVRLLVPLSLPAAPWSVLNAVPQGTDTATTLYVSSQGLSTSPPAPATGWTADDEAVSIYYDDAGARHFYPVGEAPPAQAHYTTVPSEQIYDLHTILWTLWLGGAAVMTVWFLSVNLIFRRRAARSAQPVACAACPVPVYVTDTVPSPCLVGLFRQRIYVTPACLEDPARLRHVLAHELTHHLEHLSGLHALATKVPFIAWGSRSVWPMAGLWWIWSLPAALLPDFCRPLPPCAADPAVCGSASD